MRYFFISATYSVKGQTITQNFTLKYEKFPTNNYLMNKVGNFNEDSSNIVIIGITELTEEDFNNFWE